MPADEFHLEVLPHVLVSASDGGAALVLAVEAGVMSMVGYGCRIEWSALVQVAHGRTRMPRWRFGEPIPDGTTLLVCRGRAAQPP